MYLNLNGSRRSGKTTSLVKIATSLAATIPDYLVLFVTRNGVEQRSVMQQFKEQLDGTGADAKVTRDSITMNNNGSKIIVMGYSGTTSRGVDPDCAIIDNIDLYKKEDQINLRIRTHSARWKITSSEKQFEL